MEHQALLSALLDLADQIGFEVRREYLGGDGGGLCRLRGKWVLFVDTGASVAEQLAQAAGGLANREELESKYILPQVRQVLDEFKGG